MLLAKIALSSINLGGCQTSTRLSLFVFVSVTLSVTGIFCNLFRMSGDSAPVYTGFDNADRRSRYKPDDVYSNQQVPPEMARRHVIIPHLTSTPEKTFNSQS